MSKTRGLLPQSVLLNIMNLVVKERISPFIETASADKGIQNFILGGSKGCQPQDVSFTVMQVLEKGRDRRNQAAVAQADEEKFHDFVPWGFTLQGLLLRRIPAARACAALRLHRLPEVYLRVGDSTTPCLARSRGVLTGASSSGLLARISVEDAFLAALPELQPLGFRLDASRTIVAMSWSDNLFTFSHDVQTACNMMAIWSGYLTRLCGLRLKPESHEVISASHRLYRDHDFVQSGTTWHHVSLLQSLGQCISCTGAQAEDRRRLRRSWEASFWRNSKILSCERISLTSRLQFWRMLSCGIGSFKFSMWTPSCSAARMVEGWHNLILQRIMRVRSQAGEPSDNFCRRRNRAVATARDNANLGVTSQWALCLVRWLEHLKRHPDIPAAALLEVQDDVWLQTIRALTSGDVSPSSLVGGRTGTRSGPGKPIRWSESWVKVLEDTSGIANPLRDKGVTRERAQMVEAILQYGRLHGEELRL